MSHCKNALEATQNNGSSVFAMENRLLLLGAACARRENPAILLTRF